MKNDDKILKQNLLNRYTKLGLADFSDETALELVISYSEKNNFHNTAHRLISEYGSLTAVLDSDPGLLIKNSEISENSAVLLRLIPLISRIISLSDAKIARLSSAENALRYFQSYFVGITEEILAVVYTDNKFTITAEKKLAFGSSVSLNASCRKIVEFALKNDSSHIFIAHNHPIGSSSPSENDLRSTKLISETLGNIGINLIDHIIVAKDSAVSMKKLPYTDLFGSDSSCGYII